MEALADDFHVWAEATVSAEILFMAGAPLVEGALALGQRKALVDLMEPAHASTDSVSIAQAGLPPFLPSRTTSRRPTLRKRLLPRTEVAQSAAGSSLRAREDEREQLIRKRRRVPEAEANCFGVYVRQLHGLARCGG